ncbi:MAG TPA: PAS domain S-box protein, partial [Sphingobacteriaceae bacterium]
TDLLGKNVFSLIHEEDRQQVLESFNRLKSEKRVKTAPFRFKDGHGEYRWLESIGTNLLTDPAVKGIVVNSKDITERINYIQAIEEQNTRLREISWIQSHIVRAPLCRIMGLVDLLTTYSAEDQEILFEALLTSAHELDEIIQNIVKKAEQLEK